MTTFDFGGQKFWWSQTNTLVESDNNFGGVGLRMPKNTYINFLNFIYFSNFSTLMYNLFVLFCNDLGTDGWMELVEMAVFLKI